MSRTVRMSYTCWPGLPAQIKWTRWHWWSKWFYLFTVSFYAFHVERTLITPSYIPACDLHQGILTVIQSLIECYFNLGLDYSEILSFLLLLVHGIHLTHQFKKVLLSKWLCRRKITASLGFLSSPQSKIEVTFNRRITVRIPWCKRNTCIRTHYQCSFHVKGIKWNR